MDLFRNCIQWCIKKFHGYNWFSGLFTSVLIGKLIEIDEEGKKVKPRLQRRPNQIACLALHSDVFRGDLEALSQTGEARILIIPTGLQQLVHNAFFARSADIMDFYHADDCSDIGRSRKSFTEFLRPFFSKLTARFGVVCVLAPNCRHAPDLEWGTAAQNSNATSIVLFREGLVNFHRTFEGTRLRHQMFGKLRADFMFVINETMRNLMTGAEFATPDQIKVVGTPRMDKLVSRAQRFRLKDERRSGEIEKKKILVLYFWPGKYQEGFVDRNGLWRPPGVPHKLFELVFRSLIQFGVAHPDVDILIKPKIDQPSIQYLFETFAELDEVLTKHRNLKINPQANIHDEIETATATVGLNSTAMLEAGLFGRRVIAPFFREFRDSQWSERFGFKNDLDAFDVPEDANDFLRMLESALLSPIAPETQYKHREELFEQWISSLDGTASIKCVTALRDSITFNQNHTASQLLN